MIHQKIADIWNPSGKAAAAMSGAKPDKTGRIPFYPYCSNKLSDNCRIGKQQRPCKDCEHKSRDPVSSELIKKHMNGQKEYLGIYPLVDDKTAWVAGDFDRHNDSQNPDFDIKSVISTLTELNQYHSIPFYLFSSKSANGYHLYLFADKMIDADKFRLFYSEIIKRSDVGSSFDSMFPKQGSTSGIDIGNLIAMPFHGQSFRKKGSCWLDPGSLEVMGSSVAENAEFFLEEFETVSENEIDEILDEWGIKTKQKISRGPTAAKKGATDNKLAGIVDSCAFLSHCRDNAANLTEPHWFMMIQVLAREYGGPALIHDLSKNYRYYDPNQTDLKIMEVLNRQPGPVTCRHIKTCDNKFECGKDCGVTCPTHLNSSTQNHQKQHDIEWVTEILIGVKQGERKTTARRLAGFWLKQFDGDHDRAVKSLLEWNTRNTPPLPDAEIIDIAGLAEQRIGLEEFGNATELTIIHLERHEYPDGQVQYQVFTEDNKPYIFTIQQLVSKDKFQIRIIEICNFMPPVPMGKGSNEIWRMLINGLLKDAAIIEMPEEETANSVVRNMIDGDVRRFMEDSESENFNFPLAVSQGAIVWNNMILVKLDTMMQKTKYHDELKKLERKEIAKIMKAVGFVYNTSPRNIKGKRAKFWEISVFDFSDGD